MIIKKPEYYDRFRCLAGACPDSCCKEWDVEIDGKTAEFYRNLQGKLGEMLRHCMYMEDNHIYLDFGEEGQCPFWQKDGLCEIQAKLGEQAMCCTCRDYPRISHDFGNFIELGLELSCPEAARLILTSEHVPFLQQETAGGICEYDEQAMKILLQVRATTLELLEDPTCSVPQVLALILICGHQAQQWLDEGEEQDFNREDALSLAKELAEPGGEKDLREFFLNLEVLTDQWTERLKAPVESGPWGEEYRSLAAYFVQRYYLQAVADYDLISRVKFTVLSCALIHSLGGNLIQTAQLFSKEIENDAENMDAILDGAYQSPALTDARLLGMLTAE